MDQQEQMQFFYEIFDSSLPRLGPGDNISTINALDLVFSAMRQGKVPPDLQNLKVLDVGCGNGAQTIQLAQNINGTILAVDNHQPFLDELERRAEAEGVSDKIQPYLKDMGDLGPEDGTFDLIWSEGALYSMGFREGLLMCRSLLASGGWLAVTELCWHRPDPPEECRKFFASQYPPIADIDTNLSVMRNCGYGVLEYLILPKSAWQESYYDPLEVRLRLFREKFIADPERMKIVDSVQLEIEMYRMYGSYYGYVFYIMQPNRA